MHDSAFNVCCRPQYNWGSHVVRAYWVFFKSEEDRKRALTMTGRYLASALHLSPHTSEAMFDMTH